MSDEQSESTEVAVIEDEVVAYKRPPILPSADEFTFVMQMAEALSRSQLVPTSARGKPADVAIILLAARDMGIPVTQALAKLHVIEGKLSLSAEMMVALALRDGHRIWCEELTGQSATACAQRKGSDYVARFTFTLEDADRAKLLDKDNWKKYPKAMLWARAVSGIVRMELPDVTAGVTYTPEEVGDEERFSAHPATVVDSEVREALAARISALPDDRKAELKQAWSSWGLNPLSRLTVEEEKAATELIGKAEAIDVSEAPGAPGPASGPDGPPKAPEAQTGTQAQPPLPTEANAPVDTADPTQDAVEAAAAGEGDTGHCAECGGPIWHDDDRPGWEHADHSDDLLTHAAAVTPAGPEVDVDALYASFHPTCAGCGKPFDLTAGETIHMVRGGVKICDRCEKDGFDPPRPDDDPEVARAKIVTEVGALTQTKLLKAIVDAKLPGTGSPTQMRERLVEHRLAVLAGSA